MWDYYAHTKGAEVVLKSNGAHADENMPLLFGNAITNDKSSQRERRHGGQKPQSRNQHQMLLGDQEQTPTRRPHGCLRWQMIWWVKGLMNHPILSDGTNVELLCTTQGGEAVLKSNDIHANGNMPLSLANAIRKGKASESKPWHRGETPQSRHQHQMLVGDREQTSNKRPNGCLR
jgi:hypothetical protein